MDREGKSDKVTQVYGGVIPPEPKIEIHRIPPHPPRAPRARQLASSPALRRNPRRRRRVGVDEDQGVQAGPHHGPERTDLRYEPRRLLGRHPGGKPQGPRGEALGERAVADRHGNPDEVLAGTGSREP